MKGLDAKSVFIGFLVCVIFFITIGQRSGSTSFEHITCKSVTIVNDNNKEAGYFGLTTTGSGMLDLNSPYGDQLAYIGATKETSSGMFTLFNNIGTRVSFLGTDAAGSGQLNLHSKFGQKIISTGVDAEAYDGIFDVNNSRGELASRLTVIGNEGMLILMDANGNLGNSITGDN